MDLEAKEAGVTAFFRTCLLLSLLFLSADLSLADDRSKFSILLVSNKDSAAETMSQRLQELRQRLGLSELGMPIHFLPIDSEFCGRLGLAERNVPVLGVVLWNSPEHLGPRRFVGDAFAASATVDDVPRVVQSFLRLEGRTDKALPPFEPADTLPISGEVGLVLKGTRFECSGSPLLITNFGVRLQNESLSTIRGVKVRFYVRRSQQAPWLLCQEKVVEKIASHQALSSDFIGHTGELGLLDADKNAVPCFYRAEVETDGVVSEMSGSFTPSENSVSP